MMTCTVHEPPKALADRTDRAETLVFVKEGFSWGAALLTPFWAIASRLWLFFVLYLAAMIAVGLGLKWLRVEDSSAATSLILAIHLVIGLEASQIRRWTMRRRGWRTLGSVNGRNMDDCERRFFDDWLPSQPLIRVGALSPDADDRAVAYAAAPLPPMPPPALADRAGGWRSAFGFKRKAASSG